MKKLPSLQKIWRLAVVLCVIFDLRHLGAVAQMGMEGMGMGSGRRQRDKEPVFIKADVPRIACDVCEIAATEIFRATAAQREAAPMESVADRPGGPKRARSSFSEADVNTVVQDACNRRKEVGEWLWYADLVSSQDAPLGGAVWRGLTKKEKATKQTYVLVETRQRGGPIRKWDRESATLKRSCVDLFDDDVDDLDDFIVPLWRGDLESETDAKRLLCKDLARRCGKPRTPISDGEREDFVYDEQEKSLLDTERMMQNMEEQGMPMVMQSREDMMEELIENLVSEGMSEEEAQEFIDATTQSVGQDFVDQNSFDDDADTPPDDIAPDDLVPDL